MMMDCPKCGFNQPKDRFCANCGVDVDQLLAKPTPVWLRVIQNPNLHLSLIGLLILLVLGYIFYTRSELVTKQMDDLFRGTPLSSRDSGGDEDETAVAEQIDKDLAADQASTASPAAFVEEETAPLPAEDRMTAKPVEIQKIEVSSWEVPRELLSTLIVDAEKLSEAAEGRAYYWAQGSKVAESIQQASRPLALSRTMSPQVNSSVEMETPGTGAEAFDFGFLAQVSKAEPKDLAVRWQAHFLLPAAENAASETQLNGSSSLVPGSMLMVVIEPSTRTVREESLTRAGEGPWTIFASEAFRAGATELVLLIQPK